jgi:hypothetical protein
MDDLKKSAVLGEEASRAVLTAVNDIVEYQIATLEDHDRSLGDMKGDTGRKQLHHAIEETLRARHQPDTSNASRYFSTSGPWGGASASASHRDGDENQGSRRAVSSASMSAQASKRGWNYLNDGKEIGNRMSSEDAKPRRSPADMAERHNLSRSFSDALVSCLPADNEDLEVSKGSHGYEFSGMIRAVR